MIKISKNQRKTNEAKSSRRTPSHENLPGVTGEGVTGAKQKMQEDKVKGGKSRISTEIFENSQGPAQSRQFPNVHLPGVTGEGVIGAKIGTKIM